ncbi:MAG TPA: hypothetical protein VMF66_18555 [Candidatus Acidoferrum sp.]|nr:hypothetical protein [Candidatus Acidoferrum sp.]
MEQPSDNASVPNGSWRIPQAAFVMAIRVAQISAAEYATLDGTIP